MDTRRFLDVDDELPEQSKIGYSFYLLYELSDPEQTTLLTADTLKKMDAIEKWILSQDEYQNLCYLNSSGECNF